MRSPEPLVSVTVLLLAPSDDVAFARALRLPQVRLIVTSDARSTFEMARTHTPDVILATFDRGVRDERLDLCRQLCSEPRTRDIPVLLTAETIDVEDLELATAAGGLALAAHPHDGPKIVGAIRGVLAARNRRLRDRAQSPLDESSRRSA